MSNDTRITARAWHVDAAGVAAFAVLGVACYFALAQPVIQRRAASHAQAVELEGKQQSLEQLRSLHRDTQQRLDQGRNDLEHQEVRLASRTHVNERLAVLTDLAARTGIAVEKLAPGPTSDGTRHGTMVLRLSGRGPYLACEDLVTAIHKTFNDTAVTTLKLAGAPDQVASPVSVELELLWFTAPDVKVDAR